VIGKPTPGTLFGKRVDGDAPIRRQRCVLYFTTIEYEEEANGKEDFYFLHREKCLKKIKPDSSANA